MRLHFANYVLTAHLRTLSTIIFPALSIKRENRSQYKRLQSNPVWNVIERNVTCRRALCNVTCWLQQVRHFTICTLHFAISGTMHYALSTYSTNMILLVCYVLQTFYVKHGIVNSSTYCNRVVHVLVGASAPESLKANNANLEAISKLANSIFAGMKFLRISKVNFCGKLSYESLKRFTILLGKLSCGIFEGDQTVN